MRNRFFSLAGATVVAAGLAACGSNPIQPTASYPSTPVYPGVSTAPSTTYPSATTAQTVPQGVEFGRVTDIQTVQMGATSATNPSARNAVVGGIIGAVVGNIAGKHINDGDNRSAATVLGGAAGAVVGNRIGQRQESTAAAGAGGPAYRVTVQTDQGQWRTYEVGALGDLRVGDRVRVENGVIYRS